MNPPDSRMLYLWRQFEAKKASRAELDELLARITAHPDDPDSRQWMLEQFAAADPVGLAEGRWRPVLERILGRSEKAVAPIRFTWIRKHRWAAAAAVLLLAAGLYWLTRPPAPTPALASQQQRLSNDIAPGGNKAVLTLGSGAQIQMDSAHTGLVAQQGSASIIKSGDGSLTYRVAHSPLTTDHAQYNTMTTPRGGQYKLTLPDGTRVWLNAASSIRYPTAFTGNQRKVTITGEAYLEVARDPQRPFSVEEKGMTVDVLGTRFNVNGYDDEDFSKTTLVEGAVNVNYKQVGARLQPGMQAEIYRGPNANDRAPAIKTGPADIEQTLAWKNGLFRFKGAGLETVMRQIARWYDVDVVYKSKIPDYPFVGKIPRDVPVSEILKLLELTGVVHFTIQGKKISVTS